MQFEERNKEVLREREGLIYGRNVQLRNQQ